MKNFCKIAAHIAIAIAVSVLFFSKAHALSIAIDDGNGLNIISDQSVSDSNTALGTVTYNLGLGDWTTNVTTGISDPVMGSASSPELDLNSVNVSSLNGGNLSIMLTDTGFIGGNSFIDFFSNVGGTTDGSVKFNVFVDLNNGEFGINEALPNITKIFDFDFSNTMPNEAFSMNHFDNVFLDDEYSITMVADISHQRGVQNTSFNFSTMFTESSEVPLPSSLALFAIGLLGFRFSRRGLERRKL